MNILPQKSWHVRTKKNIERVRRDEEKAAEEEKERQRRIALAEQEARTELLRQKAKKRLREDGEGAELVEREGLNDDRVTSRSGVIEQPLQHINFFSEIEQGKKLSGKNAEHEAEKREEQEKLEMKIGLLTYLGQGSAESQTEKPWYLKKGRRTHEDEDEDLAKSLKQKKRMEDLDPMNKMMEYVTKKKKSSHSGKHKKHKHKHRHRDAKSDSRGDKSPSSGASQPSKSLEQLRAERLRREAEERQKTEELMRRLRGEPAPQDKPSESETASRGQRYNSQYNPDFVRQPKHRRDEAYSGNSLFNSSRGTDRYHDADYVRHGRSSSSSRRRGKYD